MNADYDIVIIGGGIHGAACAQAAAAKNYSVLLLEQKHAAGLATSSASSKLIHGGLRYLESAQFRLVYECLRERRLLLKNAPHLVQLEKFFIPIYHDTRRRPWQVFIGLCLYSLFSAKKFHIVPKHKWPQLDHITQQGLQCVFQYVDAKTDDRKLTQAVIASAKSLGAEVKTSALFLASKYQNGVHRIVYRMEKKQHVSARLIVNCAGPWVQDVLQKIEPITKPVDIDLVLGTHIVIDRCLEQGMYYLEAPQDGRAVFVMPWKGKTLLGTTEVMFTKTADEIVPPVDDVHYLLDIYRHYFKDNIEIVDVLETFAGCRVLPRDERSVFKKSRETLIHQSPVGVFSIYGGKLTAHRATAERVIKRLARYLPERQAKANTRDLRLPLVSHL